MTTLLDHITATIVGTSVLLLVVVMQFRTQQTAIQRAMAYTTKKQAIEMGTWIQEDMANIGAGLNLGSTAVSASSQNTAGYTNQFSFKRKLNPDDESAVTVNYVLVPTDTLVIEGRSVNFFQLERRINDVVTGRSPRTLTSFHVDMLDSSGRVTTSRSLAKQVQIRFSSTVPYRGDGTRYLRGANWKTVVPLRNLDI